MLDGEDNIVSADWKSVSGIIHLVRSLLTFNFKHSDTIQTMRKQTEIIL